MAETDNGAPTNRDYVLTRLRGAWDQAGGNFTHGDELQIALIYAVMDVADALRESKPVAAELSTEPITWSGSAYVAGESLCIGNSSAGLLTWADVDVLRGAYAVSEMTGEKEPINALADLAGRIAERLPPRETQGPT